MMKTDITLERMRRTQILDAALRKISELGIQAIKMDDIVLAAGLSKGGIAYYFNSKEDLIIAAFKEFFDRIFQRTRDTMAMYQDPLKKILSFSWLFSWDDPDVNIGYPLLFDCISMAGHNEKYRSLFHNWVENWIIMLKDALDQGVEAGIFSIDDTESTARIISSIYHGLATRWYLDPEPHTTEWAFQSFRKAITPMLSNTTIY